MGAPKGNKYAAGHNSGAPTKYKPEFAGMLLDFFGATEEAFTEREDSKGAPHLVGAALPTFERFAWSIGVCARTLYEWSVATGDNDELLHKDFSLAYARAKTYQAALMLEGGMVGALAPSFTGLAMKNIHGWKDKLETENTHTGTIDLQAIEESLAAARAKREEWQAEADERIAKYST